MKRRLWFKFRKEFARLAHIEQALRSGRQPVVPREIASKFAKEIEAVRVKPEVRAAYWAAAKRSKNGPKR